MRKIVASLLLYAFLFQSGLGAQAAGRGDANDGSAIGVRTDVAAQVAATFLSEHAFLVLATTVTPSTWTPPMSSIPAAPVSAMPTQAQIMAGASVPRHFYPKDSGVLGTPPVPLTRPITPAEAAKLTPPKPIALAVARGTASVRQMQSVTTSAPNTTGINPWWTYESGALAGIGPYMANVASGNLIVQSTDVDIPERGIDLAFRRTYNSQSTHDYAMTDGSALPAQYGPGWTNTFDAHIATNSAGGLSVFDIDGARYDYTPNGTGCLTAPAGQHNQLCYVGSGIYGWYKKNGTVYEFLPADCANTSGWGSSYAGYNGRIWRIYARNNNNYIAFNYYWANSDSSNAANLTQLVAQHSDGHALSLNFSMVNGQRLLTSLVRPDNVTISYGYDGNNNFSQVYEAPNNVAQRLQYYSYYANHQLYIVHGPRNTATPWGSDGGWNFFSYYSSNKVENVFHSGFMNPTPSDGTGQALQTGPSTGDAIDWYNTFTYNTSGSLWTNITDSDGHQRYWYFDSNGIAGGRVGTTYDYTGSQWLTSTASWDASNNVTATIEPRGWVSGNSPSAYETDYYYDGNGNTLAVAAPAVNGYRPTTLLSYDSHNNIVSSCDPVSNHNASRDWAGGTPATCPNSAGVTRYTWDTSDTTYEPNGRLSDTYTPLGYHSHIAYDTAPQGGDFGLPTSVSGDSITQVDGTVRTPSQTFTYDVYGNLKTYAKGVGTTTLTYDGINEPVQLTDADGITSYKYYYPNGQIQKTETASQHAGGTGSQYTYDADGDEVSDVDYYGAPPTPLVPANYTTKKYYDGADRLVEVQQPYDSPNDVYLNAWITRYLYDLTKGGSPTVDGVGSVKAYGNLFATQELLPTASAQTWTPSSGKIPNTVFRPIAGNSYDALDRPTNKYTYVNTGQPDQVNRTSVTYDGAGNAGLLSQSCDQLNKCSTPTYNALGQTTQVNYNDGYTPTLTYTYDADGRPLSINSTLVGTQSYAYDADGRKTTATDPSGISGAAQLTYAYYADGMRKSVDVAPASGSNLNLNQLSLLAYSYRADGLTQQMQINNSANAKVGNSGLTYAYKTSGRLTSRSEFGPMANPTAKTFAYDANGQMNSETTPRGTFGGLTYSPEGELTAYNPFGAASVAQSYSARGELVGVTGQEAKKTANGLMLSTAQNVGIGVQTYASVAFDSRMGVQLQNDSTQQTHNYFGFDAAGREGGATYSDDVQQTVSTHTRSYDAQNHLISDNVLTPDVAVFMGYLWGPNGHPAMIGKTTAAQPTTSSMYGAADSLHWDGDQLLFTTNSSGQVDDIKIGNDGEITPLDSGYNGLTWWDRDPMGTISSCHNATGSSGNGTGTPGVMTWKHGIVNPCAGGSGAGGPMTEPASTTLRSSASGPAIVGAGGLISMPGRDGISDGQNTIQGVRSYDSAAGAWTTPDAYSGEVHDPASQKSYMWNNGNPVGYSDPSGYSSSPQFYQWGGDDALAGEARSESPESGTSNSGVKDDSSAGTGGKAEPSDPFAMGDYGSRGGDAGSRDWAAAHSSEANSLGTDPSYEIGTIGHSTSSTFVFDRTVGGGNGNNVGENGEYDKLHPHVGDVLVHSHGHLSGDGDFAQHPELLAKGFSAVYTLAGGFLWVQWTGHLKPEKIYNVSGYCKVSKC